MICVTLGNRTNAEMIAAHRELARAGAQLVELRLDLLEERPDVAGLLEHRPCAVIVTCRRREDGGRFDGNESERRAWLQQAAAGADYVDLERDTAVALPRAGAARRIVSYHNFEHTPDDIQRIHSDLAACEADLVKIATMAKSQSDNVRMLRLVSAAAVPTTAFCMGEMGLTSRVLTGKYGAPFTYAAADERSAVAPGQLSFAALRDLYRYDSIGSGTEVYGVVGDPIGHSLSPLIHNRAFAALKLNKVYLPIRVPAGALAGFLDDAGWLNLGGLSVTIPHKEAVAALLGEADATVQATGAANTVVFGGARPAGYNTDVAAAVESLREAVAGGTFADRRVLILGAGGAARAVAHGLKREGAHVVITGRTATRAAELAEQIGCRAIPWDGRAEETCDILVNCTPLGMSPEVDATPIASSTLKPAMVVFDTVYNPEKTRLLCEAASIGCTTVSGREMFVRQAAAQFRLFTGRDAPLDLMRDVVARALATS